MVNHMNNPQLHSEPVPAEAQLLTIPEAAQRLKIGRTKVFELIALGELEAVRFGPRSTRVPSDSVDALVARMRAVSSA
jgi:excisionase family DNA binding protein